MTTLQWFLVVLALIVLVIVIVAVVGPSTGTDPADLQSSSPLTASVFTVGWWPGPLAVRSGVLAVR